MFVEGKRIEIEEDDEYATKIENGEHLMLWNSNLLDDLWIDKYDVRMFFVDSDEFQYLPEIEEKDSCLGRYDNIDSEEEEIMSERYQDLTNITEDEFFTQDSQTIPQSLPKEESYQLPSYVSLPSNIEIPKTLKLFQKIAHTTKSIRMNPQLEVLLRVRQSENPAFSFLNPGNNLYPFYQFLKSLEASLFWNLYLSRQDPNRHADAFIQDPSSALCLIADYCEEETIESHNTEIIPPSEEVFAQVQPLQEIVQSTSSTLLEKRIEDCNDIRSVDFHDDLLIEDCEENKFWMVNHFQKSISKFLGDIDGDLAETGTKEKQNERLRKAKLLSGYYSLQLQSIEKEPINSTKSGMQSQNKRNLQGTKLGLSNSEDNLLVRNDLTTLRAEILLQKYQSTCKRQKICPDMRSAVYQDIQAKVISSLSIDSSRLKNKIEIMLSQLTNVG